MWTHKPTKLAKKIHQKLSEGDKVSHPKFGIGMIKEKFGYEVYRVAFEKHGTMEIHYDFLTLI